MHLDRFCAAHLERTPANTICTVDFITRTILCIALVSLLRLKMLYRLPTRGQPYCTQTKQTDAPPVNILNTYTIQLNFLTPYMVTSSIVILARSVIHLQGWHVALNGYLRPMRRRNRLSGTLLCALLSTPAL